MRIQFHKLCVISLALLFALTPFSFDFTRGSVVPSMAQAKSDKSGGNGNSNKNSSNKETRERSETRSNGLGLGQNKEKIKIQSEEDDSVASISSKLGRLNAANASATARANAAPHSAVGRIAAYEDAVYERLEAQDQLDLLIETNASPEEIAEAQAFVATAAQLEMETLEAAANKEIDQDVIDAVNELLGIEMPGEELPETTEQEEPGII